VKNMLCNWVASPIFNFMVRYGCLPEMRATEDLAPVGINYQHSTTDKIPEATSVHNINLKHGTAEGMCPFIVHRLTSEEYDTTHLVTLRAVAAKHLDDGGKVLIIGHSKELQSIWKNPQLYPQMFP
jgi:hypothetical protein